MKHAAVFLLLFLAACEIPAEESDLQREARFRMVAVCVAYHDLRGRGAEVDTTDAESREAHRQAHRQAMEVCDQLEHEGGEGMGLSPHAGT